MQAYTHYPICTRRLEIGLRVPELDMSAICHTYQIGTECLSVDGAPSLRNGQGVEVTFDDKHGHTVSVDCIVEPHIGSKLYLRYRNLHKDRRERLAEIVWPPWDGGNLLDGVVLMAGRFGASSFQDWLRLTSLLATIQPRMASRRLSYA